MKKTVFALLGIFIGAFLFSSCAKNFTQDEKGFTEIEKELKSKFGENAYYTNLSVSYDSNVGTIILATVTDNPESLKMGEWHFMKGSWKQISDVTLELGSGVAEDYMYKLGGDFDLKKVGKLVEESIKKLSEEKQINDAVATIVSMNAPNNRHLSETQIFINLKPKNGGTSFTFFYALDGKLISFDY